MELVRSDRNLHEQMEALRDENRFDGLVASLPGEAMVRQLHKQFPVPSVYIDNPQPKILAQKPLCVFVIDDDRSIAHAAVGHFTVHCHPETIAFVPARVPSPWSESRQKAFVGELARRGRTVAVYGGNGESRAELIDWIGSLAKPVGVLAAFDDRARDVLEACRSAGLRVPEDVSVLGIGNDEPVCEMTVPKLTSVAVDFEAQGYRAARELQAMMLRKCKPTRPVIPCGVREVVIRASTATDKSDTLARRAVDYIAAHALDGITPEDVVRHLNVSRSLVDLRIRQTYDTTLLEAILVRRLGEVKRLLETTKLPIQDIAVRCGYRDANYLKNQFRRKCGMSMRDWRKESH